MTEKLDLNNLPNHVAIICDGNRRWARGKGLPDLMGHKKGFDSGMDMAKAAFKLGIKNLSFWMFSTENWTRTEEEVGYLMNIALRRIKKAGADLVKDGIKFKHIGRKDRIPKKLAGDFKELEEKSKDLEGKVIHICVDHGGKDEIVRGVKTLVEKGVAMEDITEDMISQSLDTVDMPEVDLMIRTSGEYRTSGFLTWKSTYAELAFPEVAFPDFNIDELKKVLVDYQNRDRRFGGDSEKEDKEHKMVSKT